MSRLPVQIGTLVSLGSHVRMASWLSLLLLLLPAVCASYTRHAPTPRARVHMALPRWPACFVNSLPDAAPTEPRSPVLGAHYTIVRPTPAPNPKLVAFSADCARLLGLEPADCESNEFLRVFSGADPAETRGWTCWATVYTMQRCNEVTAVLRCHTLGKHLFSEPFWWLCGKATTLNQGLVNLQDGVGARSHRESDAAARAGTRAHTRSGLRYLQRGGRRLQRVQGVARA